MNVADVFLKYNIFPRGIIHIGAHMCQELNRYIHIGKVPIENILFIEGNVMVYERCKFIFLENKIPCTLLNAVIADDEKNVEFNVPASLCKIKDKEQSHLTELCKYKTKTTTLPKLLYQNNIHN